MAGKNDVWTICHSDGPARLQREEPRLAFSATNPLSAGQTLSSVPGLVPREGGFPPTGAAVGQGHGSGSLVSRAGPQPVT